VAAIVILAGVLAAAGCAGKTASDAERLHARASFEAATKALEEGKLAQALTLMQQVTAFDPEVALYRNVLGIVYLQVARPDLALAEFKRATELDRDYADAYLNLGTAHAEQQQWAAAVTAYERAIKSPRLVSTDIAYQNLGLALFHLQRYSDAEQALRFAINLDPAMAPAYYHLGLVLAASNRKDEARQAFERARDLGPNTPFGQAAVDRLKALPGGG
jgi:tetratricopeptide (TPR) repeat protein